jgi:DNA polymerase III epsilon subunit-like protein
MNDADWILLDTETTGFSSPIFVVELAAQRMRGWQPIGMSFRRLLNQNAIIPPEASRVHGYTREILERDGAPAPAVYREFSAYTHGLPLVSYNTEYDLTQVLLPEWKRLGIEPIGTVGFCALRLSQRLLDPVPAGNCKLQTLRQFYRLPERGAHTALGDVQTVVDLLEKVLKPIAEKRGLHTWAAVRAFTEAEWFPSRIAFGRFKGRDFRDAAVEPELRGWLDWLSRSTNGTSAKMGRWYLDHLEQPASHDIDVDEFESFDVSEATSIEDSVSPHRALAFRASPRAEQLRLLIANVRTRLADTQADYTKLRNGIESVQSVIFNLLSESLQKRDNLRLVVSYRRKFIQRLLEAGEQEASQTIHEFESARAQSRSNYQEAASAIADRKELSVEEAAELNGLFKKLARLYHPDLHAQDPEKAATYTKLMGAINNARDRGDIASLREIASDPEAYILKQGWDQLDFSDASDVTSLRKCYDALQVELLELMDLLTKLQESPERELYELSIKQPGILEEIAAEQVRDITSEITKLEQEAAQLKSEIAELTGAEEERIT